MYIHPILAEYVYLRNISVKILPLQRLVDGPKRRKQVFPQFILLLVSQFLFFKLLMPLNNLHEDKFCSDETQVKQFICLHTDSLISSQVSKP